MKRLILALSIIFLASVCFAGGPTIYGVSGPMDGVESLTDGGILLGSGTGAITALGAAANGQIPIGDGSTDPQLATITGTADQITVTNGAGSITLSTPQDIATTSAVTFAGVDASAGAIITTGAINGAVKIVTATGAVTLTTAQYGSLVIMTTTDEVTLPDVCDSATGAIYTIMARDAEKFEVVFTDSSDAFILYGTTLTAGNELDSAGGAGNSATVVCGAANTWYVRGTDGIFVDGGAAD